MNLSSKNRRRDLFQAFGCLGDLLRDVSRQRQKRRLLLVRQPPQRSAVLRIEGFEFVFLRFKKRLVIRLPFRMRRQPLVMDSEKPRPFGMTRTP